MEPSAYTDNDNPLPDEEAVGRMSAGMDQFYQLCANTREDTPGMGALRVCGWLVSKNLMVDEATCCLANVHKCLGKCLSPFVHFRFILHSHTCFQKSPGWNTYGRGGGRQGVLSDQGYVR